MTNSFKILVRTKKNDCAKRNDRENAKNAVNKQPVEEEDEEEEAGESGGITVTRELCNCYAIPLCYSCLLCNTLLCI